VEIILVCLSEALVYFYWSAEYCDFHISVKSVASRLKPNLSIQPSKSSGLASLL
jgi:hypothetical protein